MLKTHRVTQGDRRFLHFAFLRAGQPWPVVGWTWVLTCKRSWADAAGQIVFQKTSAAGGILPYDTTSVYAVIDPEDTRNYEPGRYRLEFEGTSPEGDPVTVETAHLHLEPELNPVA